MAMIKLCFPKCKMCKLKAVFSWFVELKTVRFKEYLFLSPFMFITLTVDISPENRHGVFTVRVESAVTITLVRLDNLITPPTRTCALHPWSQGDITELW